MTPGKCPKCGARAGFDGCGVTMMCGTWVSADGWTVDESRRCVTNHRDQLAAEIDRLKAENEKLRGLVVDAYAEGWSDYDWPCKWLDCWECSNSKSRLEGRSE